MLPVSTVNTQLSCAKKLKKNEDKFKFSESKNWKNSLLRVQPNFFLIEFLTLGVA